MLNKSNPLRYMTKASKNSKKKLLLHYDPIVRAWVLSNGVEETFLRQFVLSSLHLFDSNFSEIQ